MKKEKILPLILEGYTAPEIAEMIGYKTDAPIYAVARENGLTITSPKQKREHVIRDLALAGNSIKSIELITGACEMTVRNALKRMGLSAPASEAGRRTCEKCGKEFVPSHSAQKYCCRKCGRKPDDKTSLKDDSNVPEMLRDKQPDWEYIGGYTGNKGYFYLRHKLCGNIYYESVQTARHGGHLKCECCDAKERKSLKEQKQKRKSEKARERRRIAKIWREFNKPVHGEQIQAKLCPDCGAFYLAKKDKCPDCSKAERKRYENRRKDLKRKGSHTEQSKEISAYSVYVKENGRCWLCGGQCDINADPNSDMYPSVDHVLPQSLGGKDTWENVHCAHRICNSMRGNDVSFIEPATAISPKV